jgi:hypothetical protein
MAVPSAAGVVAPARSHGRRRIIKAASALVVVVAIVAVGSTIYAFSLPGVGDALARRSGRLRSG